MFCVAPWAGGTDADRSAFHRRVSLHRGVRVDRAALIRRGVLAFGLFALGGAWPVLAAVWTSLDGSKALVRNSSGAVVRLQVPSVLPSVAAGGGAASLKASQVLVIGNAVANLELTRDVPVANLAKVARVAARALGPLALVGLVYDGVQWVNGEWTKPEGPEHLIVTASPYLSPTNGCTRLAPGQKGTNAAAPPRDWYWHAPSGTVPASSWDLVNYCSGGGRLYYASVADAYQPDAVGTVPATDQDLEISFQQGLIASPSLAGEVLDAALASSEARAQLVADALQVTGPATVDGGTSTSTRVDTAGTTTIQTATTYNLSYQGDTVNLTQTQVETVTDPANNVTTTTTTTATPTGEPPPPEEESKFCEEFPDASACQELGEHEPDGELGEEERALSWSPELSAAGSCPSPITLSIMGTTQSLEWSSVCDLASGVRPVVIALAWLSAAVFVFGVGRVTAS